VQWALPPAPLPASTSAASPRRLLPLSLFLSASGSRALIDGDHPRYELWCEGSGRRVRSSLRLSPAGVGPTLPGVKIVDLLSVQERES
jgi:hypothetical protein